MTARQSANGHRAGARPADWTAPLAYAPAEGTPLLACHCGAVYFQDEPSSAAHLAVFGHQPRASESGKAGRAEDEP